MPNAIWRVAACLSASDQNELQPAQTLKQLIQNRRQLIVSRQLVLRACGGCGIVYQCGWWCWPSSLLRAQATAAAGKPPAGRAHQARVTSVHAALTSRMWGVVTMRRPPGLYGVPTTFGARQRQSACHLSAAPPKWEAPGYTLRVIRLGLFVINYAHDPRPMRLTTGAACGLFHEGARNGTTS